MQRFLWSNSLFFGILSGDFQHANCSVDVVFAPQTACQWLELFFLISKQILCPRVFSVQVSVLKIFLLVLLKYGNKFTVRYQYALTGNNVLRFIIIHILSKFIRRIGSDRRVARNSQWGGKSPPPWLRYWARPCFGISNSKWFVLAPGSLVMALDGFIVVLCCLYRLHQKY